MDKFLGLVTSRKSGTGKPTAYNELSVPRSNSGNTLTVNRVYQDGTQKTITIPVNDFDYSQCPIGTWIVAEAQKGLYHTVPLYVAPPQTIVNLVPKSLLKTISTSGHEGGSWPALSSIYNNAKSIIDNANTTIDTASPPPFSTLPPCPHKSYIQSLIEEASGIGINECVKPDSYMRIGDVTLELCSGPLNLEILSQTQLDSNETLRQSTSMKKISGTVRKTIQFSLLFDGPVAIASELVPLLRQSKRAPFIPIVHGELLRNNIDAIAIQSIAVNTIPEFPLQLEVTITAYAFNANHYLMDADTFEESINYALLDMWLKSGKGWTPENGVEEYYNVDLTWNGRMAISLPSEEWLQLLQSNRVQNNSEEFMKSYYDSGTSLLDLAGKAIQGDTSSYKSIGVYDPLSNNSVFTISNPMILHEGDLAAVLQGDYVAVYLDSLTAQSALKPTSKNGADYIYLGAEVQGNTITMEEDVDGAQLGQIYNTIAKFFINSNEVSNFEAATSSTDTRSRLLNGVKDGGTLQGRVLALYKKGGRGKVQKGMSVSQELTTIGQIGVNDQNNPIYDAPIELQDFYIESVSFVTNNSLADVTPSDLSDPIYQCVGSSDTIISFSGYIEESDSVLLQEIIAKISELSVSYRGQWDGSPYGGFCFLSNEIARIAGLTTAIPVGMSLTTVEGFPTLRRVQINFVAFDVTQRRISAPSDFNGKQQQISPDLMPSDILSGMITRAQANKDYEDQIQKIDLYPDIAPPLWRVLWTWLTDIREGNVWSEALNAPYPRYSFLNSWAYTPDYLKTYALEFWHFISATHKDGINKGKYVIDDIKNRPGYVDPDFYCAARGDAASPVGKDFIENSIRIQYGLPPASDDKSTSPTFDPSIARFNDTENGFSFCVQHGNTNVLVPATQRNNAVLDAHIEAAPTLVKDGNYMKQVSDGKVIPVPHVSRSVKSSNYLLPVHLDTPGPVATSKDDFTGEPIDASTSKIVDDMIKHYKIPSIVSNALMQASKDTGVPETVAFHIANVESSFNPNLPANSSGCMGLLQINREDFTTWSTDRNKSMLDPYQNAYCGLKSLSQLQKRYATFLKNNYSHLNDLQIRKLSYQMAGCGYNTGPGTNHYENYIKRIVAQGKSPLSFCDSITALRKSSPFDGKWRLPSLAYCSGVIADNLTLDPTTPPSASKAIANSTTQSPSFLQELEDDFQSFKRGISSALPDFEKGVQNTKDTLYKIAPESTTWSFGPQAKQTSEGQLQPPGDNVWDFDRAAYDPNNGEDIFYSMRKAENAGRLIQAYPSYLILLVNGGSWLTYYRIFDTFYGLHSPMSIEVFSSRETPADTCVINFADPYNQLSAQSADIALAQLNDTRDDYSADAIKNLFHLIPGDLLDRITEETKSLLVKPGNRLHVRLGYGANASELPIVFNGVISQVQRQNDSLAVVGLGDGVELVSQLDTIHGDQQYYDNIGAAGQGKDPRNIILDILTASTQPVGAQLTAGFFGTDNPYGIQHFGDVLRSPGIKDGGEAGVSIYSGWGDKPVNVTTTIDEELVFPFNAISTLDETIDNYTIDALNNEISTKIAKYFNPGGSNYLDGMTCNEFWRVLNGEVLVGIKMEHATPWEVFETLRKVCIDYISAPEPFSLRSSLFFGKDWWPYHYKYDYDALTNGADLYGGIQNGIDSLITLGQSPNFENFFRRRPFLQFHTAHSGYNLIASQVDANYEGWYRQVQSVGTVGGIFLPEQSETSLMQMVDASIYNEFQNQKIIHSGLSSTVNQRFDSALANFDPSQLFLTTNALNNHAVGQLHDEVRLMYDGDIWTYGNGYIRPRHIVHLQDDMKQLSGLVEVRSVTHAFTPRGGFITRIQPDCVAYAQDSQKLMLLSHMFTLGVRLYFAKKLSSWIRSIKDSSRIRKGLGSILKLIGNADDRLNASVGEPLRVVQHRVKKWMKFKYEAFGEEGGIFSSPIISKSKLAAKKLSVGVRSSINPDAHGLGQGDVEKALDESIQELVNRGGNISEQAQALQKRIIQKSFYRRPEEKALRRELGSGMYQRLTDIAKNRKTQNGVVQELTKEEKVAISNLISKTISNKFRIVHPGEDLFEHGVLTNLSKELLTGKPLTRNLMNLVAKKRAYQMATTIIIKSKVAVSGLSLLLPEKVAASSGIVAQLQAAAKARAGFRNDLNKALKERDSIQNEIDAVSKEVDSKSKSIKLGQLKQKLEESTRKITSLRKEASKAANVAAKLVKSERQALMIAKFGKLGVAASKTSELGAKLLSDFDPYTFAIMTVAGGAINTFNRWLASRHALKVFPLRSCGREFSAGINGHRGAVVGDHLGPLDNFIESLFNSSILNNNSVTSFLLGLQDPLYGPYGTEDTSQYLTALNAMGVSNTTDSYQDILAKNQKELQFLATLNDNGPRPQGITAVETGATNSPNNSYNGANLGPKASAIVDRAKSFVGNARYVLGAGHSGYQSAFSQRTFDCSGLIQSVFSSVGITNVTGPAASQANIGVQIVPSQDFSNLQPGDRLYFSYPGDSTNKGPLGIGHTGLYIGNGEFVEASSPRNGIRISKLSPGNYNARYLVKVMRSQELYQ